MISDNPKFSKDIFIPRKEAAGIKNGDKVIPIINISKDAVKVKLNSKYQKGVYTDWFTNTKFELKGDDMIDLKPWSYLVLVK